MSVTALGVCEFSVKTATCWDMNGAMNPELTDQITADAKGDQQLSLRFGVRNRFMVVHVSGNGYINVQPKTPYNGQSTFYLRQTGNERTELIALQQDETRRPVFATASYTDPTGPAPVVVPCRSGGTATSDHSAVSIGKIAGLGHEKPFTNPNRVYGGFDPYNSQPDPSSVTWRIDVGYSGTEFGPGSSFTPLDERREPIQYVDADGNPATPLQFISESPVPVVPGYNPNPMTTDSHKPRKYHKAFVAVAVSQIEGALVLRSNLNPAKCAYLSLRSTRTLTRDLGPFPPEPTGAQPGSN